MAAELWRSSNGACARLKFVRILLAVGSSVSRNRKFLHRRRTSTQRACFPRLRRRMLIWPIANYKFGPGRVAECAAYPANELVVFRAVAMLDAVSLARSSINASPIRRDRYSSRSKHLQAFNGAALAQHGYRSVAQLPEARVSARTNRTALQQVQPFAKSAPGNWTLDTVADLLAAMDAKLTAVDVKLRSEIPFPNALHANACQHFNSVLVTPRSLSGGSTGVAACDPRKFCLLRPLCRSPMDPLYTGQGRPRPIHRVQPNKHWGKFYCHTRKPA